MNNLFLRDLFVGHAGQELDFKIECDSLSNEDIECCAYLLSKRLRPFSKVEGIPRGGVKLAKAMEKYIDDSLLVNCLLVCDDVYTTGSSFREYTKDIGSGYLLGAVIFARDITDQWITPLFSLTPEGFNTSSYKRARRVIGR